MNVWFSMVSCTLFIMGKFVLLSIKIIHLLHFGYSIGYNYKSPVYHNPKQEYSKILQILKIYEIKTKKWSINDL